METKRCSCCANVRPLTEFRSRPDRDDGLTKWCVSCLEREREKQGKSPEKRRARARRHHLKNHDRINTVKREWRGRHYRDKKTCQMCCRMLPISSFKAVKDRPDGRSRICTRCLEKARKHRETMCEVARERDREAKRRYFETHRAQHNERGKAYSKVQSASLADAYVRRCLTVGTKLRAIDIPDALVELKREQLRVYRLLKEKRL